MNVIRTKTYFCSAMAHNDFADSYKDTVGETVLAVPIDDHFKDKYAVAVLMDDGQLGYIAKSDRKKFRCLLKHVDKPMLEGRVVRYVEKMGDGTSDVLELEFTVDFPEGEDDSDIEIDETDWSKWLWTGKAMQQSKEAMVLNAFTMKFKQMLQEGKPWDENMQKAFKAIYNNAWADLSKEQQEDYEDIHRLLIERSAEDGQFRELDDRMRQIFVHVDNPATHSRIYRHLVERSMGKEMDRLMKMQTEEEFEATIPVGMRQLLKDEKEDLINNLSYLGMPRRVLWDLYTIVCLRLRYLSKRAVDVAQDKKVPLTERMVRVGKELEVANAFLPPEFRGAVLETVILSLMPDDDLKALQSTMAKEKVNLFEIILGNKNSATGGGSMLNMAQMTSEQMMASIPQLMDYLKDFSTKRLE